MYAISIIYKKKKPECQMKWMRSIFLTNDNYDPTAEVN